MLHAAARRGLGISALVSLGNKADVSGNDLPDQTDFSVAGGRMVWLMPRCSASERAAP